MSIPSITPEFKAAFQRVQQSCDFDCAFAVIAMIAGKTLEDVQQTAINKFKHPKHGPYWITEHLIVSLLAHYGFVGTSYKQSSGIASLPDLCIGMVEYNPDTDIGRHVLFHRMAPSGENKLPTEYIIDPAYWINETQHIRTDIKGFPISWYIGIQPMYKAGTKAPKPASSPPAQA